MSSFFIAQQVADSKSVADITSMFKKAKELAGKRPNVLISDGARNFHQAFTKAFYTIEHHHDQDMLSISGLKAIIIIIIKSNE